MHGIDFIKDLAVVMLVVAFFLLPIWISNDQGRQYLLDRLNRLAR